MASLKFSPEIDRQWPSPACCVRAQSSLFITTVQIRAFFSLSPLSLFFAVVFVRLSVIGRGQNIAKEWCPLHSPKGPLFRHIHRSGHSKKKKKWLTECSYWKMNLDFLFKVSIMTFSSSFLRKLWKSVGANDS